MIVAVRFHGLLAEWLKVERAEFILDEPARFADLLAAIHTRFHGQTPKQLWGEKAFARQVWALSSKGARLLPDEALEPGQVISFYLMIGGG
jgi:hypothetical protein